MEIEEAIKRLEHMRDWSAIRTGEAMDIAIDSMRFRVRQKPIDVQFDADELAEYWTCPNCKILHSISAEGGYERCCDWCGQAIDWSDS